MNVVQHRELRRHVLGLAYNAAQISQKMPTRVGGYLISVQELMAMFGRRRLTQQLLADIVTTVNNLCGSALSLLAYDQKGGDLHLDFNDQLVVDKGFLYLGQRAYRLGDWT